jgi:hypothetical protein
MAEDFSTGSFDVLAKDEDLFEAGAAALPEESSLNEVSAVSVLG